MRERERGKSGIVEANESEIYEEKNYNCFPCY